MDAASLRRRINLALQVMNGNGVVDGAHDPTRMHGIDPDSAHRGVASSPPSYAIQSCCWPRQPNHDGFGMALEVPYSVVRAWLCEPARLHTH